MTTNGKGGPVGRAGQEEISPIASFPATSAANRELLAAYWAIGHELADRETQQGWGSKVVIRLSADIRSTFPDATGFSPRNLRYMKSFARAWPDEALLQAPLTTLPWYHHIALLEKLADRRLHRT